MLPAAISITAILICTPIVLLGAVAILSTLSHRK